MPAAKTPELEAARKRKIAETFARKRAERLERPFLERERFRQLTWAICLYATYVTAYRHGTADRALALSEMHKEQRALEEQRQRAAIYGTYIEGPGRSTPIAIGATHRQH